jgi:pre-mRNA-processing factor 39
MSHPFWDKYLEFEDRVERPENIFSLLGRIVAIPLHQYTRYFQKYRLMAYDRKLEELVSADLLQQFSEEVGKENTVGRSKSTAEVERDLRTRIDAHYMTIYNRTQSETTKRWVFEKNIKRPFFHVNELEDSELESWRMYLDWEEAEDDFQRTMFLYERCLVPAASYDEFWLRYARWMQAQGKVENARIIYMKASCIFAPIARPEIRYSWSLFEESQGHPDAAEAILEAMLIAMPGHFDTIMRWSNLKRRQEGASAALEVVQKQAEAESCSHQVKGALIVQAARLLQKIQGSPEQARALFKSNVDSYNSVQDFWSGWLEFEMEQQPAPESAAEQLVLVRDVHTNIRGKSSLPPAAIKELSTKYLQWLLDNGGAEVAKEYMEFDVEING